MAKTTKDMPSRQVLDAIPGRVLTFLIGRAKSVVARTALARRSYTQVEQDYAWSRLRRLGELPKEVAVIDHAVADAIAELNAWDEPNFECIQMALDRSFPQQSEFLFENLVAHDGEESVPGVETLLDRLDALESSPDRQATREQDHAALALLATRGYTTDERGRLRDLVGVARRVDETVAPLSQEERDRILLELYRWHRDWAAQAKKDIKGRATLITLGLASRRSRKDDAAEGDEVNASAATGAASPETATGAPTATASAATK